MLRKSDLGLQLAQRADSLKCFEHCLPFVKFKLEHVTKKMEPSQRVHLYSNVSRKKQKLVAAEKRDWGQTIFKALFSKFH